MYYYNVSPLVTALIGLFSILGVYMAIKNPMRRQTEELNNHRPSEFKDMSANLERNPARYFHDALVVVNLQVELLTAAVLTFIVEPAVVIVALTHHIGIPLIAWGTGVIVVYSWIDWISSIIEGVKGLKMVTTVTPDGRKVRTVEPKEDKLIVVPPQTWKSKAKFVLFSIPTLNILYIFLCLITPQ